VILRVSGRPSAVRAPGAEDGALPGLELPQTPLAPDLPPGMMPASPMNRESRRSRGEILAEIRTFVANWFRDGREEGLEDDTPLVTSGIVDSAGVLEVVEFLEGRFGVRITDTDITLHNCNTLQALADLVVHKP
jgi:acyl carrier protein